MRFGWLVIALIALNTSLYAQSARPTPTPMDGDDIVKISTNLIQVDITVVDKNGKPIRDLRQDEVEIYENGVKQQIANFSFVAGVASGGGKPKVPIDRNAPPIPQAVLRAEQIRRTIALVVDDLSLSFERAAHHTRRALKRFVDEQMQAGDLVAIIRTGAGIGALQQFTSDRRMLYAAIEKVKWNAQGSGGISVFAPIQAAEDTPLQTTGDEEADDAPAANSIQSLDSFRTSLFATGTLGALSYIVKGMGELPGRKSVILFSDGFKIIDSDDMADRRVLDFLLALVDAANRSSVVFYTIDARGLAYTGFTAVDQVTDTSPEATNRALSSRRDQLLDNQEGLAYLADETGGFAVKNTNDLSGGVEKILADQSYYLIGYEPDSDTFDPVTRKFNQLTIKVSRPQAKARYRSGFFNVAERNDGERPIIQKPVAQLETALLSPFAVNGIDLRLNALFGSDVKKGAFVRSLLHIKAADLKFIDEKDGSKKAVFDILAMSFGDNGQSMDQIAKTYTLILKPEAYMRIFREGFVYHFMFPVKTAGAYQYRVALRDVQGGKLGSASQFIDVPNLKKNRPTISSLVIENLTNDEWRSRTDPNVKSLFNKPMSDTAIRRVNRNSVLRYGFEIYNARLNAAMQPVLNTRIRVFRDGTPILDGSLKPIELNGQTDLKHLKASGAVAIGEKMLPGDYILQVIVTDGLATPKKSTATQIVQFEVVD